MKMRTPQWATKLQPEGKRGGGWRGEGWSGKTHVLLVGGKTQHGAQQESSRAHLEGLLQARATTEKLRTVDRNGLGAAGARVRAEKETVPIPKGCRHKHPDEAHPDNRVQPPNPHHPFVMTSFIPKATKPLVTKPRTGSRSSQQNWLVTTPLTKRLLVLQASYPPKTVTFHKMRHRSLLQARVHVRQAEPDLLQKLAAEKKKLLSRIVGREVNDTTY